MNETSSKDVEQSLIYVITGFKKEFGENLRKFRTSTGMTQTTASNLFQVTLAAYSQWETGKISPRPTKVEEICKALNIDPADLINVNPVSSEAIYDRRVPILSLDFFKAKTFGSAFREFHNQDISCSEKVKADEYGKYDYAVRVTNTDMVSDRVSLPNGGIALCSWKDLMGKEPLEQMQVADGTLALVSIVYNTVVFREVHFDGKFLTLKCWNKDQEENRFPLSNIKDYQYELFEEIYKYTNNIFYIIEFRAHDEVYLVHANKIKEFRDNNARKSIPYKDFKKLGVLMEDLDVLKYI